MIRVADPFKQGSVSQWDGNTEPVTNTGSGTVQMEAGKILRLVQGEDVTFSPGTNRPNGAFLNLVQTMIREMSMGMNMPYGFLYDMSTFGGHASRIEIAQAQKNEKELLCSLLLDALMVNCMNMRIYSTIWTAFVLLLVGIIHAEDFTTVDGDKYTNAIIKRIEPDGLVISYADGLTKLKFKNLPADVQTKYGYDPQKEAQFKSQLHAAALARQEAQTQAAAATIAQAQEAQARQIQNNIYSIKIIETDQRNYIGKIFYLNGTIELSSFYMDGYLHAQDTHNAFEIRDGDIMKDNLGIAYVYLLREKSEQLRQKIISSGGKLNGVFKVTLLPDRFEDSSGLFLELLDFYPPDIINIK